MDEENLNYVIQSPLVPNHEKRFEFGGESTKKCIGKSEVIGELKKQMKLGGPLIMVNFLQYSLQMISIMFAGRLGELCLSSAAMATSFADVTGFSIMLGMGSALDTLCGQAYGAKQYHMLGIHMQRALLVLMPTCIPIAFLWAYTGKIFITIGQDPEISLQAGIYACWLIPSIFPYVILQCQLGFLQTQNNVWPLTISTGFTSLVHILACWILVFKFGFGVKGTALSNAISYWINVLILTIYIKFSPACQKTWTGFSKEGMKDLLSFIKLAIPSALMICLEFWSYEFLVLMSGLLPNPKQEASMMSISLDISAVVYTISYGFGIAISTRVSNELGARRSHAARLAVNVVLFLVITEGLAVSLLAVAVRGVWGYMYTNEEKIIRYLAAIMPLLAASNFIDGIQGALSGTARGCGWQKICAYVNLGAYYLVGLPAAIILTFVFQFGGKGLWMGILCGNALQTFSLLAITMSTNWEKEARKAKDRVHASSIPADMVL